MKRSARTWWIIYALSAAAVFAILAVITAQTIGLQQRQREAQIESARQQRIRLALWRLDSRLTPWLAREAARPYFHYAPFYPQERAYTRMLSEILPGEVLTPSPLLTFQRGLIRLHFQWEAGSNDLTSPQTPRANLRDLAEDVYVASEELEARELALKALHDRLPLDSIITLGREVLPLPSAGPANDDLYVGYIAPAEPERESLEGRSRDQGKGEIIDDYAQRSEASRQAQQWFDAPAQTLAEAAQTDAVLDLDLHEEEVAEEAIATGPFRSAWIQGEGSPDLVYVRTIAVEGSTIHQGFVIDWPALRTELLADIADLFPDARLLECGPGSDRSLQDDEEYQLAAAPVLLAPGALSDKESAAIAAATSDGSTAVLLIAWIAGVIAVATVGLTLAASIAFGETRSRFASSVTHELRTPLTTFRMYAEMLAEGMVTDPARRAEYLQTLRRESERLSGVVENVLTYSRLEEGRSRVERSETLTAGELVARLAPDLDHCAAEAGASIRWSWQGHTVRDAHLTTDPDAVGQILTNLVDNACKYALDRNAAPIEVDLAASDGRLLITVTDHGPGIESSVASRLFRPFERGSTEQTQGRRGLGLGLAISRELAQQLGGDLTLRSTPGQGCRFTLALPKQR